MKIKIAIIKNQTFGGGDRYSKQVISQLAKRYKITIFSPEPFVKEKNKILNIIEYIRYVYWYLPNYYRMLGNRLNKDLLFENILIFQDSYRKCPDIFQTLVRKSVYILHEPPREFYERLTLHAPAIKDILFTICFRWPVYFSDRLNTKKSDVIVSNSEFSRNQIWRIYNKKSIVVYPGLTKLSNKKFKRTNQCISVGSFLPYKGHDIVIKSLGKIDNNRPSLVLAGNGTKKQIAVLKSLAVKNNVKLKISITPNDSELGKLYLESKIYVNCAKGEPFGMTSLEAVGHGCQLVTINDCGTKEIEKFYPKIVSISENNCASVASKIIVAQKRKRISIDTSYFRWSRVTIDIINLLK